MKTPREAFIGHRANAKYRGIEFELTFKQWLRIWVKPGHLEERGRKRGQYVMARKGDTGPYAVGNVSIVSCSVNCAEGNTGPSPLRGRKLSKQRCVEISRDLIGRPVSEETRRKIGAANSKALKGRPWSAARRAAQHEARV